MIAHVRTCLQEKQRAAPTSFALFVSLLILMPLAAVLSFLYFHQNFFRFPPCLFRQWTGLSCFSCGFTRAIEALTRFRFLDSLRFHPAPLLIALLLFALLLFAGYNVKTGKERRYTIFFIPFYGILAVTVLFTILRNLVRL